MCHYIEVLPMRVMHDDYFQLEVYLLKNHLHNFAKKISPIMIKLIHYYPAKIYPHSGNIKNNYEGLDGRNLRSASLEEIEKIIYDAILYNKFFISILLGNDPYTLISIGGEKLGLDIYNASDEFLKLLDIMAQREGLFLKKYEE